MTSVGEHYHRVAEAFFRRKVVAVTAGAIGGCVLGIAARGWMRLISGEPEFTWSGTIFIVIGFTVFVTVQSVTSGVRRRSQSRARTTAARVGATVAMLPLFVAAGALMFPTVIGAGLAVHHRHWPWIARIPLLLIAAAPIVRVAFDVHDDFGMSLRTVVGVALLIALYAKIVWIAAPVFRPTPLGSMESSGG